MSRNEAQTRFELIDPALEARGWKRTDIRIEVTAAQIDIVDGKPRRRPTGRSDYLLRRPLLEAGERGSFRDGSVPKTALRLFSFVETT